MDKLLNIIQIINNRNKKLQNALIKSLPVTDIILKKYIDYTTIHGPSSAVLYIINNRTLLFFRDVHIKPKIDFCNKNCNFNKCIWVSDFLKDLFMNSPMCIDFFCETTNWYQIQEKSMHNIATVEHYIKHEKLGDRFKGLLRTKTEFMDCLSPLKKGCTTYKKTRFHNIEFRRFVLDYYDLTTGRKNIFNLPLYYLFPSNVEDFPDPDQLNSLINIVNYNSTFKNYLNNLGRYRHIVVALLNNDMVSLSNIIDSIYSPFDNYQKQKDLFTSKTLINKSPYPKLSKQIVALQPKYQNYLKDYVLKRYDDESNFYITNIREFVKNNHRDFRLLIEYIDSFYTKLAVLIFDTYTIARIMKAIFNYDDSSLIITYAGEFHIDQYEQFFNKFVDDFHIDLEKITEIGKSKDDNGCIILNNQWDVIIRYLQNAFNNPSKCSIKEGIPFSEL